MDVRVSTRKKRQIGKVWRSLDTTIRQRPIVRWYSIMHFPLMDFLLSSDTLLLSLGPIATVSKAADNKPLSIRTRPAFQPRRQPCPPDPVTPRTPLSSRLLPVSLRNTASHLSDIRRATQLEHCGAESGVPAELRHYARARRRLASWDSNEGSFKSSFGPTAWIWRPLVEELNI
jgi:hypothetical protein